MFILLLTGFQRGKIRREESLCGFSVDVFRDRLLISAHMFNGENEIRVLADSVVSVSGVDKEGIFLKSENLVGILSHAVQEICPFSYRLIAYLVVVRYVVDRRKDTFDLAEL